jgi:3-carboxy-cis,cis-muconate cycloisomerase
VGTLAAFGSPGLAVAAALADDLRLTAPDIPWHAHRDRVVEVATTLGLLVGTLGKIARDLALLAQTEVGEAFEPAEPGKGASSTLPQKRNPVGVSVALAAATRVPGLVATMLAAMPQEHERGLGGWQAEWETLPEIVRLTAGSLWQMAQVAEGMDLDADHMRANLDLNQGVIAPRRSRWRSCRVWGSQPLIRWSQTLAATRSASASRYALSSRKCLW